MADFRVIIVGGGIGGLTLANCLQHAKIDFVLLEGRKDIGSDIGSGVGIDVPAARVLDQLGIYSSLENLPQGTPPRRRIFLRDHTGRIFSENQGPELLLARTGYPSCFWMRAPLLETLRKHIWDQDKVQVGKRVSEIDFDTSRPKVICEDGSTYTGDVVVGCDGVHSFVRSEMWRMCEVVEPARIPPTDKTFLTTEYRGLYGTSNPVNGFEVRGSFNVVVTPDYSCYWMVNKDGTIMWALLQKLDKTYTFPNLPRYSNEEARAFAESKLDMVLVSDTDQISFKALWDSVQIYSMVPVEEGDLKIWTAGRIVCIGDSVHKITPEAAVGTVLVVESAALLANGFKRLLDNCGDKAPNTADIERCLNQFQISRHPRASAIVKAGLFGPRFFTLARPSIRLMVNLTKYVLPPKGDLGPRPLDLGAEHIEFLPLPARSQRGTMAYHSIHDFGGSEKLKTRALFALPLFFLAFWSWNSNLDTTPLSQMAHVPTYLIWMLEGSRRANQMRPSQCILLFSALAYFSGTTSSVNLWFFLHWIWSPIEVFAAPDMRLLQMNYTKALLPTVALMTILPAATVLIYPGFTVEFVKLIHSFSPYVPIVLTLSHRLFATFFTDTTPFDRLYNVMADLPWIRSLVCVTDVALMALFNYLNPTTASRYLLTLNNLASFKTPGQDLGGMIWLLLLFRDLKRARMTDSSWLNFLACYLVSISLVGPGATFLAAWLWREETLAARRM